MSSSRKAKRPRARRARGPFQEWCAIFQKANPIRARIVLQNIRYDCENGRIGCEAVKMFHDGIHKNWRARRRRRPAAPVPRAEALVAHLVRSHPEHLLCQGTDVPERANCSRIMDSRDLIEYNIDFKQAGWSLPCDDIEATLDKLERRGLSKLAKGQLKGALPVVWVTKTAELDKLRQGTQPERLADDVRDALGLHHYHDDQYLAEVVYPPGAPGLLRAPTFLEGEGALVYRSMRGSDRWGRTVDLRTLASGLPEAVHAPVPFTADFAVRKLGRLTRCSAIAFKELKGTEGFCDCSGKHAHCEVQVQVQNCAGLGKPGGARRAKPARGRAKESRPVKP